MNDRESFEQDVADMLEGRVANLPTTYEIGAELVHRARRKRATKLTALAVGMVVVVVGVTGAIAQSARRRGPQQVITSTPTSTAPRPRVATVDCPVIYRNNAPPLAPPSTSPRAPTAGDPAVFATLESFAATNDPRYVVLGPASWSCWTTAASGRSYGMVVYDSASATVPSPDAAPIAIENDNLWNDPFGALLACSVFDDAAVVEFTSHFSGESCLSSRTPHRTVTRVDAHVATFVDADGNRGVAWMVLPSSQSASDGKISVLECRPSTGQISAAACDTIIADYAARNDAASAASAPTTATTAPATTTSTTQPSIVSRSIADPPFSPMSWVATATGVVISKYDGSGPFAAYDAAADSWRTLPAPSFAQPTILASRANRVFVTGGPAGKPSTTMPFAMLDTNTGEWHTLTPLPDRVFGSLAAAGDTGHIFAYGAYDDSAATVPREVALEYDIASDAWSELPRSPLSVRAAPAMQWTGRELLVWSGGDYQHGGPAFSDGAAFDPATRRWRALPTAPVPARAGAASVWTGTEMLVWGGSSCVLCGESEVGDGAAYDPATNTWTRLPLTPLQATGIPAAVWSGSEMIVFSGRSVTDTTDVAAYGPATDQWRSLPAAPPSARGLFQADQAAYAAFIGHQAIFGIVTPGGQFGGFKYTIG